MPKGEIPAKNDSPRGSTWKGEGDRERESASKSTDCRVMCPSADPQATILSSSLLFSASMRSQSLNQIQLTRQSAHFPGRNNPIITLFSLLLRSRLRSTVHLVDQVAQEQLFPTPQSTHSKSAIRQPCGLVPVQVHCARNHPLFYPMTTVTAVPRKPVTIDRLASDSGAWTLRLNFDEAKREITTQSHSPRLL